MNVQNIYAGLQVEPFKVNMIEQIHLTARIVDPIHFAFVPGTWEKELRPFKAAKWEHETHIYSGGTKVRCLHNYEIKSGIFLAFPQFNMTQGGFYAAHLYMIAKELQDLFVGHDYPQCQGTLTVEGLLFEARQVDGIKSRLQLKPRGLSKNDTAYHAILGLP